VTRAYKQLHNVPVATMQITLAQGWANLVLEGHCPAEFSSISNQTPEQAFQCFQQNQKAIGR